MVFNSLQAKRTEMKIQTKGLKQFSEIKLTKWPKKAAITKLVRIYLVLLLVI